MVHVVEKVENGLIMASALILQMQKLVFAALILLNAPGAKHPGGILKKSRCYFQSAWEGFDLFVCRSKALINAGKLGCNDCWGYFSCLHHFGVTAGAALNVKNVFLLQHVATQASKAQECRLAG